AGVACGPPPVAAPRRGFHPLGTEVMSGQFLDILHRAGGFASAADAEQAALSVIRWKTVPYTVLRPVRIGAALMGGSQDALERLSEWAVEVGTAFQLRDDLLSVVGDQQETGKPIGGGRRGTGPARRGRRPRRELRTADRRGARPDGLHRCGGIRGAGGQAACRPWPRTPRGRVDAG